MHWHSILWENSGIGNLTAGLAIGAVPAWRMFKKLRALEQHLKEHKAALADIAQIRDDFRQHHLSVRRDVHLALDALRDVRKPQP